MTNLTTLIKDGQKEMDEFKVAEYGKWKIGRAEAKFFLEKFAHTIALACAEALEPQTEKWGDEHGGNGRSGWNDCRNRFLIAKTTFLEGGEDSRKM